MCHPEVPPGARLPDVETEEVQIELDNGERLPAVLALPARTPAPGVLVINDVFGRSGFYEQLTRRIAQGGFVGLDVEYFFREGGVPAGDRPAAMARAQKLDQRRTLDDFDRALAWLATREEVSAGRFGVIGFCMGGTLALDVAASRDDVAAVSYYGFPARARSNMPTPIEAASRMNGPILGHWGTADEGAGMDNVRELERRLAESGIEHEFHFYEGLGHGFLKALLDDESATGHEQACESWTRTIDFWRRELAGGSGRRRPAFALRGAECKGRELSGTDAG
jgi:carboxymethylenebutenolidase